jgi:uncharacterized membrane protein
MNEAHFHMVVNHFPIIGTILGLGILVVGYFQKNNSVKNTAYILFIVTAIFAAISMATGEGAEEMVEDMPNIGHKIIHEHEEMAEKLAVILYLLGIVSIAGLYTNIKNRSQAKLVSILAIIIGAVAIFFAQQTGTTGGEIRHTEIRADFSNNVETETANDTDNDED